MRIAMYNARLLCSTASRDNDKHAICPVSITISSCCAQNTRGRLRCGTSAQEGVAATRPVLSLHPSQLKVSQSPDMSPPTPSPPAQPPKPQRVLACVRCQHRKVKCDRRFPCSNCNASYAQCVPATLTPRTRRKRRFPERELLERLRNYEDLLRQNNVNFEPLHKDSAKEKGSPKTQGENGSEDEHPGPTGTDPSSPATTLKSEKVYEAKYVLSKNLAQGV
jgi:Fungal Zn(2)-Cys(6) binuclear cluster domain